MVQYRAATDYATKARREWQRGPPLSRAAALVQWVLASQTSCQASATDLPPVASMAFPAAVVLAVAGDEEKRGKIKRAIELYGTHLRCMAVHCFHVRRGRVAGATWRSGRARRAYTPAAPPAASRAPSGRAHLVPPPRRAPQLVHAPVGKRPRWRTLPPLECRSLIAPTQMS